MEPYKTPEQVAIQQLICFSLLACSIMILLGVVYYLFTEVF